MTSCLPLGRHTSNQSMLPCICAAANWIINVCLHRCAIIADLLPRFSKHRARTPALSPDLGSAREPWMVSSCQELSCVFCNANHTESMRCEVLGMLEVVSNPFECRTWQRQRIRHAVRLDPHPRMVAAFLSTEHHCHCLSPLTSSLSFT